MTISSEPDSLRGLCESLIGGSSCVGEVCYHRHLRGPWSVPRHAHDDILQLDFTQDVVGEAFHEGSSVRLGGTALLAFYPGASHGFTLPPQSPRARIFSVKLRVDRALAFLRERPFPVIQQNPTGSVALPAVLKRLYHLRALSAQGSDILTVAVAMQVLAMWPRSDGTAGSSAVPASVASELAEEDPLGLALSIIEGHMTDPPNVTKLAKRVGLSRRQLTRRFHDAMGMGPMQYFQRRRLDHAKVVLASTDGTITEAAASLGFPAVHPFSRWFSHMAGMPPSQFREQPGLL
jgi:AraC-like DNA-binding protein